jgi:hypothetical protein
MGGNERRSSANQSARTATLKSESVKAETDAPRIISDHIMLQEDFERLHKFLLETEGLPESPTTCERLVKDEWPELVHKLPPKVPTRC